MDEQKTLRDEFAMAALTAYLGVDRTFSSTTNAQLAKLVFELADAMMKARNG